MQRLRCALYISLRLHASVCLQALPDSLSVPCLSLHASGSGLHRCQGFLQSPMGARLISCDWLQGLKVPQETQKQAEKQK